MKSNIQDKTVTMQTLPFPYHVMAKPIGPICNINCSYCFYLEKENLYPNSLPGTANWKMSDEVLETYIQQKLQATNTPVESFAWQGGEPTLLGVDYFRRVVELQKKYANGTKIENAFQTNGILIDEQWCEFFAENDFLIGLSIDGPQEIHDKYRVDKGGKPTFDKVVRAVELFKKFRVEFNTLTTVHRFNSYYPMEVYNFLKSVGSGFMQFIPIVERISKQKPSDGLSLVLPNKPNADVSDWSVEPDQFGEFLVQIFDEWVRKDVGRYYIQLFDVSLEVWYGMKASLCVFDETCGRALAIEHNGDLYSCDHYVYPENKLGNIMESPMASMVQSDQQKKFGDDKRDKLPEYCQSCEVKFICNGECPKNRFMQTPDGEEGLNYLCAGYKRFFNHIDPYMNFMANELRNQRAPANVMRWVQEQDSLGGRISRNAPCPCGSGKKYKRCCGI